MTPRAARPIPTAQPVNVNISTVTPITPADDCGGVMGVEFGPAFDGYGADARFDTTDGAEWGGGMGDYYY